MATYIYSGEINEDNTEAFMDFCTENTGEVELALSSLGGEAGLSRVLLKFLNDRKDRISIMAYNTIQSAAFEIFLEFEGKKVMAVALTGIVHLTYYTLHVSGEGVPKSKVDQMLANNLKYYRDRTMTLMSPFLTKREKAAVLRMEEVHFDFGRMREIFPDVEVI